MSTLSELSNLNYSVFTFDKSIVPKGKIPKARESLPEAKQDCDMRTDE
jgi:hypothetical protein